MLSLRGLYDEAEVEFTRALTLDPHLFEAHYLFGRMCQGRGDLEGATRHYGEAHRVRPDDYQSLALQVTAASACWSEPDVERLRGKALRVVEHHLGLHPDDVRAVYFRAHLLAHAGRTEEARASGERALRMEPDDPGVTYNLACLEAKLGNTDRALDLLERTVALGSIHRDWAEHDTDLASIRDHPRFRTLLRRPETSDGAAR